MDRKIYVYQEHLNGEIQELFSNLGENYIVEEINDDILVVLDQDYYNPEPFDFNSLSELINEDFDYSISMFIEPYMKEEFSLGESYKEFLKELPKGIYHFADIIPYLVIYKKDELKVKTIQYIIELTNKEVVHTVREFINTNLNSSESAKKLYMHRNTLNYRIDNFTQSTGINVKSFKGANAIYMLFKY